MPGGRPTKKPSDIKLHQCYKFGEMAFTDKDLAEWFGVRLQTITNWKKKYPEFFVSIKKGKDIADQKVVQSLYKRALGYSHPEVHISNYQGEITRTPIIKHYPPEIAACIFWLCNRQRESWQSVNKQNIELSGNLDERLKEIAGALKRSDTNSK